MTRTLSTLIITIGLASAVVGAQTWTPKQTDGRGKAFFFFNQDPDADIVKGVPYSAEVTTRVNLVMFDGTRLNQSVTAKVYRDSAGRTRREQAVIGLEALEPNPSVSSVIQIFDPVTRASYTLNPGSKTAVRRSMDEERPLTPKTRVQVDCRGAAPAPGYVCLESAWVPSGVRTSASSGFLIPGQQDLGTKTIEGLTATGRREVTTIPAAQAGTDRPIEIIDETWMSIDLKVALQTLHRDPRSGDVEYTLTKISRQEPAASLFTVPAGYEIRRQESQK